MNKDLDALERVLSILGPNWKYISTDITDGRSGNGEGLCFVYDETKVWFKNVAGEIVLSKAELIGDELQFSRTPFLVSFQSGWFKFYICTVHIYYGSASGERLERRIEEIGRLAEFLAERESTSKENFIVLGDFNIVHPEHNTAKALSENGFRIPEPLREIPTNLFGNKYYDQIAFRARPE